MCEGIPSVSRVRMTVQKKRRHEQKECQKQVSILGGDLFWGHFFFRTV